MPSPISGLLVDSFVLDATRGDQSGKLGDGAVKSFRLWCPYGSHRNREAYYLWRGHTDDPGGSRVLETAIAAQRSRLTVFKTGDSTGASQLLGGVRTPVGSFTQSNKAVQSDGQIDRSTSRVHTGEGLQLKACN
jgi:hypothetical protein